MSFSILQTIRRLWAPQHKLSCSWFLWRRLLASLRERGKDIHESGAFLLGTRDGSRSRVRAFVLYDDVDPHCLDTGIVHLDGRHFGTLWAKCEAERLEVVADVHTHPMGAEQSGSDQAHPIIARAGHIALIVPKFARAPVRQDEVGIYRYRGGGKWESIRAAHRKRFFLVGI